MKKVLFVANADPFIRHFYYPSLEWFKNNGYEVHVASMGEENLLYVDKKYNLPFERSSLKINNIKAYKKLKQIIETNNYNIVHCHTAIGAALTRLASLSARKKGLKVIYTAHGFNFHKGASIKNWLMYYPIEKLLSRFTDVLITINEEDYKLATNRRFKAGKIVFINGVGIDLNKFKPRTDIKKSNLRKKHNYNEEDYILIYVGELIHRKHQDLLIKAMKKAKDYIPNIKLLLVGDGILFGYYKKLISKLCVEKNVELLGYRKDISDLMSLADVAVSSSRLEGLPVNIMEAMATGLPLIVSNTRGNRDLVIHGKNGIVFELDNISEVKNAFVKLYKDKDLRLKYGKDSLDMVNKYKLDNVLKLMTKIYLDL
jgi:glycosyltransferase EpsD